MVEARSEQKRIVLAAHRGPGKGESHSAPFLPFLHLLQMQRSTVVGLGGKSVLDNVRTSYGTFLRRYQVAPWAGSSL